MEEGNKQKHTILCHQNQPISIDSGHLNIDQVDIIDALLPSHSVRISIRPLGFRSGGRDFEVTLTIGPRQRAVPQIPEDGKDAPNTD
jgi:hypothetical protein